MSQRYKIWAGFIKNGYCQFYLKPFAGAPQSVYISYEADGEGGGQTHTHKSIIINNNNR